MIWVHVVYWMVTPGGLVKELGKENKRNIHEQVISVGNWSSILLGPPEKPCITQLRIVPLIV